MFWKTTLQPTSQIVLHQKMKPHATRQFRNYFLFTSFIISEVNDVMRRMVKKIKLSFYLLLASLFTLVSFVPSGTTHAQSMMSHDMGSMSMPACPSCGTAPVVLNENNNLPPEEDQKKEPSPPTNPLYFIHFDITSLYKRLTDYSSAFLAQLRPPDLTILHGNLRF